MSDGRGEAGAGGAGVNGPPAAAAVPAGHGAAVPEPVLDPVVALEARIGFTFAARKRALSALTHKSWVNEHRDEGGEDNERLEFLGDAVVDLLVSERLMQRFPGAREGELSKMRAAVVDEAGLAAIGRQLRLGEILRLGRGEELTGGRDKTSLLADATEAVFAAVFLEGGVAAAQAILDRFLDETYARATAGTLDRDFKTQMQEVCQSRFRVSPRYRVSAEHGPDHLKIFDVEVSVNGEVLGRGSGRSKKDAEQVAARQAIELLALRTSWPYEPSPPAGLPAPAGGARPEPASPAAGTSGSAGSAASAPASPVEVPAMAAAPSCEVSSPPAEPPAEPRAMPRATPRKASTQAPRKRASGAPVREVPARKARKARTSPAAPRKRSTPSRAPRKGRR